MIGSTLDYCSKLGQCWSKCTQPAACFRRRTRKYPEFACPGTRSSISTATPPTLTSIFTLSTGTHIWSDTISLQKELLPNCYLLAHRPWLWPEIKHGMAQARIANIRIEWNIKIIKSEFELPPLIKEIADCKPAIHFNLLTQNIHLYCMSSDKIKIKHGQECPNCHGTESEINAEGLSCCANCGLIEQQTKFDSNVVFGEQRDLQGKNINKQEKFNQLSSERRLKRAGVKIQDLVKKLAIPSDYQKSIEAAHRLLRYADNCNFFKKGKRIELYAAAALYITLRFNKAPYLLIDFSDKMGIKMFPLARCYLKMSKRFGFQQQLPQIDPSLLIHRYCKIMNLGEKTEAVADSAIKLIKRMKRDWMCQGRRPSSLCGAAILIAAAIHKVKDDSCSTTKICETVFVCDQTIRRRLDEFKHTKFSKIKEQDFKLIHNEQSIYGADAEMDPPAFRKARLRSEHQHQIEKQAEIAALEAKKKKGGDFDYDEQENIPEQIIQRYSDEIARMYEKASDINQVAIPENMNQESELQSEQQSNNTGGQGELADQEENESDVDQKLIFLDEKMQQQRRKIWEDYHRAWLDKQASKVERGQVETKKKMKQAKKEQQKTDNPFEALIKNPSLGQKVNQGQLKRLLASQPKLEQEQTPRVSLTKIFDPFRWNKM